MDNYQVTNSRGDYLGIMMLDEHQVEAFEYMGYFLIPQDHLIDWEV